jgi:antitoxin (DNA-binding transcriptional repressor) of toxin-antitoxin stability system
MRAVGIKLLKNRLSEYVRLAAAGETVLVTDRNQVVAQLGPPEAVRGSRVVDPLLADAVREGLVTPASLPPGPPPEAGSPGSPRGNPEGTRGGPRGPVIYLDTSALLAQLLAAVAAAMAIPIYDLA